LNPFRDGDTYSTFRAHIEHIIAEINALDNDYILKAPAAELEQHFVDKVTINPLIMHAEEKYIIGQSGVKIDVSHDFLRASMPGERVFVQGTKLDLAIPYEGDPILWKLRASTYSLSGYPDIDIRNNIIVISFRFPDDAANQDKLKADIERAVGNLQDAVNYLQRDVDGHNKTSPAMIRGVIAQKRAMAQSVTGALTGLGIPFKRREEKPAFVLPTKRRPSPAKLPSVPSGKYEAEPYLDIKEFEFILSVLYGMATVIERSPSSFKSIEEEAIRNHFLIQLNGHYEGVATGETFNAAGKTDILIRAGNRNAFIAECKFWHGPKTFNEAIDQLFSYLTWRDSKCALLIFNKNKDSLAVRQRMHETMIARPEYRQTTLHTANEDSRYIMVKEADPGREIIVATQLYDIPS